MPDATPSICRWDSKVYNDRQLMVFRELSEYSVGCDGLLSDTAETVHLRSRVLHRLSQRSGLREEENMKTSVVANV